MNDKVKLQLSAGYESALDIIPEEHMLQRLKQGMSAYPYRKTIHVALKLTLDKLFERTYEHFKNTYACTRRYSSNMALLLGEEVFINFNGADKRNYCSGAFVVCCHTLAQFEHFERELRTLLDDVWIKDPMFRIEWHYTARQGALQAITIEEVNTDELLPEAYPSLPGGLAKFVDDYIDSPESILVLQGPPGTGKTRLIRHILARMSAVYRETSHSLYTGDKEALQREELFVKFMTGEYDAFVVEDIDHMLKPRHSGNEHMHHFLTIADGIIRSQRRKLIFSTNLPNIKDIDDALLRPGRCFARIDLPLLNRSQSETLLHRLDASAALLDGKPANLSLAELYKMTTKEKQPRWPE